MLAAPLVAEFVSGNLPIIYLWLLLVYAPLYGGGALLIRELGRRTRRPWPVILTLGLAYGVLEEAFVSFSLFNPDYAELRLLDFGWVPALGIGAWWTVFVIVLHALWSICIPIVLVESFGSELADRPWLGRRGMLVAGGAVVLGAALTMAITLSEDDFVPSPGQLAGSLGVLLALLSLAVWLARTPLAPNVPDPGEAVVAPPPRPLTVTLCAALAAVAFYSGAAQVGPAIVTLAGYAVLCVGGVVVVARWSRRRGWGARHTLALATGALVPHVGFALLQPPLVDVPILLDVAGDLAFAAALVTTLVAAWSRTPRSW